MAIAVHPLNPKILMATWNDIPVGSYNSYPGYSFSTNGGINWSMWNTLDPRGADPSVVFDRFDNVYYCFLNKDEGRINVARKYFYVSDWEYKPVSPVHPYYADKPYMAIDNTGGTFDRRLYVTWKSNIRTDFCYSPDYGDNWYPDPPYEIYGNPYAFQCPIPAVGPNGFVYVLYIDNVESKIRIKKSTNGGVSFGSTPLDVCTFVDFQWTQNCYHIYASFTTFTIDQCSGFLYVVCHERDDYNNYKLKFLKSTDDGNNWTSKTIGDLGPMYQFHPWITVDPTGKISVLFLHSANGMYIDAYVTESYNNGGSFGPAIRVSSSSFPWSVGYPHEYQGITSTIGYCYPLWTDTRSGTNADPYFARVPGDPTSANAYALASGASAKSVFTSYNTRRNVVFQSNNQLYFMFSSNNGFSWTGYEKISGNVKLDQTSNPSLNAYNNRYHSIFNSVSDGIMYSRSNESNGWEGPYTLTSTIAQCIASTVDGVGIGQITFIMSSPSLFLGNIYYLKHSTFNTNDASPVLGQGTTITTSTSALSSPSIAVDGNNIPHVVWIKNNDIYYSRKVGSSWTTPLNISNTINNSIAPSIAFSGDMIYAVWQEFVNNNWEIYYRIREANGIWSTTINLSNNSGQSIEPFVTNSNLSEPVVVWTDNTSGNYDIRYSLPITGMDGSFKSTSEESHSPTITTRFIDNKLRLMASWTDRIGTPYLIEDDYKDLLPPLGKRTNSWESQNVTNQNSIEQTPIKIYPNPYNPNTKISYELNDDSYVIVEVFDVLGRKIKTLVDCKKEAGFYSVIFDASHLKSGIYFARLTVRQQDNNLIVNTIKLLLTK